MQPAAHSTLRGDSSRGEAGAFEPMQLAGCAAVLDEVPLGTVLTTLDGRIIAANAAFASLVAVSASVLQGVRLDTAPAFARASVLSDVLRRAEVEGRASAEVPLVRADGHTVAARVVAVAVRDDVGVARVLVLHVHDVEAELAAERRRAEVETLHAVVSTLPVVLFATDREGRFVVSEGGGLGALGLRSSELVGRSLFDVYRDVPWICESVRRALEGERFTGIGRVGARVYESTYVPTRDARGAVTGVLGLALDITRRAQWERDREVLIEQLHAALELRNEFLSIASHELRTPLAGLRLRLELLLKRAQSSDSSMPASEVVAAAEQLGALTQRLTRLVDGLLDVSRIASGHLDLALADLDLSRLVDDVAARLRVLFERAERPLVVRTAGELRGRWDASRIEQIIENLLTNALKHGCGTVDVEVRAEGDQVVVRVHDEGPGIPAEAQARVFDRFVRLASRNLAGLGLGLHISREIAIAHGGNLKIESAPDQGTTFVVTLPRTPEEAA